MSMRKLTICHSITNRESYSLEKYLQEIKKIPLLDQEEEVQLAVMIQKGDKKALEKLTRSNLRFVVSVAKQYQHQGLPLSDLINEGNIGLIKAASSFDASRGFKFISYGVWWIRQQIIHALYEHARLIRVPANKMSAGRRIQEAGSVLEQKLGRTVSVEELAETLEVEKQEIVSGLELSERTISLDTPLTDDGEETMLDTLENPNSVSAAREMDHTRSLRTELERSFQTLSERQKQTLCYFFGIGVDYPMGLDAIGEKLRVTPERVRQIKDRAIEKLRQVGNIHQLKSFLAA